MPATENPRAPSNRWAASNTPGKDRASFATRVDGDAVLVCSGELDPATSADLGQALQRLLRLDPARLVVDLSSVSFFDASAIGELVGARQASRDAGGDLVIRSPSPFGRRVLEIMGLANLIDSEPIENADVMVPESTVELTGQFTAGTRASVVVNEASGLIAEHFDIGIDEASDMLRRFTAAQPQSLVSVAVALMDRTIDVARLAPHRPGASLTALGDTDPTLSDRDAPAGR